MGFFVNSLKLKAATRSMHQFCPVVRTIFPRAAPDDVIEGITVYLYTHMADEIFGHRFTDRMREGLRANYKFADPAEIDRRIDRISRTLEGLKSAAAADAPVRSVHEEFTDHVRSVIRALLTEAGFPANDPEVVRETFPRFEDAVRQLKSHLTGIKRQSRFVMK